MSTVPLSNIYPLIRVHAKRALNPEMDTAIVDASREFCQKSRYRQQSIPIDYLSLTAWYPITPANTDEEMIGIEHVMFNGVCYPCPMWSDSQSDIDPYCGQQWSNGPYRFYYEPPNYLVALPLNAQSQPAGLAARIVLQPTQTAQTLDYSIVQQYDRVLSKGALKFLLTTNDSPWTNPKMAAVYAEEFQDGIDEATAKRQTDFRSRGNYTRVHRY